ncbi:MAG: phosphatidate cytidylyltransferase [Gemmatimonadetes bacterium]|nr:phosphatidate cytidylyltransferase [Gemmatimonadota bacterium]
MIRVASGIVLAAIVAGAIWLLPPVFLLGLAELVLIVAFFEYASLVDRLGVRIPRAPSATATAVTCAAVGWGTVPVAGVLMTSTIAIAALAVGSGRIGSETVHAVAAALFAPLYLGLSIGALVATRVVAGRGAVLLLIITVIVSDTAQYYIGRWLGRRPLAPSISPRKTLEGALGGLVAGTLAMTWLGGWWLSTVTVSARMTLGALVVTLGIAGDLFESMLKRSADVKDTSGLIPGHGGMLDRIDGLLFAAPIYYVFVTAATRRAW